jgi:post-segregation antitoxin (ccd killing protein)
MKLRICDRPHAPKKSISVSPNAGLVRAKQVWVDQNAEAMEHYNERVESGGVFSDGLRRF